MEAFHPLLVSAIAAVALVHILRHLLRRPSKASRHPPGPWKLPVIGSMHHLVNVLPHRALRDLARVHGPLMMLQLGETPLVVASSREMARQVLKTHDANFATRPRLLSGQIVLYGWADILFSPSGEYWRKLRQLCAAEVLSPKRVLTFRHIREQEMASHVERIRAAGPSTAVDLSEMFYSLAISIVSRASFGSKHRNAGGFLTAMKAGVALSSGFRIPDLFPTWRPVLAAVTGMRRTLEDVHRTVDSTLEEVIEERRRARDEKQQARCGSGSVQGGQTADEDADDDENLVDLLIGLQERASSGSFQLNRNSIKAIIFDMFTAGTGTLASTLDWGMSELMRNGRVMRKLQREIREAFRGKQPAGAAVTEADIQAASLPYLTLVIKETLRLHPPVPLLVPRESVDACEIEGYTIPARSRVVVNAWAVGRDPRYWEDAEEFKPERFEGNATDFMGGSYEYIPFGAGRRMCPGISYGMPVLEMALVQLLYHFDWSLQEGTREVDMTEAHGLGVRRKSPLLLCATSFAPGTAGVES
ncbi:Premnaspirodiene oxygenase [Zea mays]|uniref:Premnaspirodiene oxygenase n=1 Tax=Zea mays TaxID=4577 RepID=A0A317Y2E3_MAIZE|nr:Premnaspirodiene oxygenase [Zea mays]